MHDETKNDARSRALEQLFDELNRPGRPGMAVGIYQGGRPIFLKGYGYADLEHAIPITPQTVFHVASSSKQFAAIPMALLARDGKLDLDADIRTYLPFVPDFGKRITVNNLVYHTSGIRDQWSLFAIGGQEIDNRLRQKHIVNMVARQRALNFDPGAEFCYSNTGYTLLGEIVLSVTGKTLREFTTERIFQPLGMTRTFFHDDVTEVVPDMAHSYVERKGGGWNRSLLNYDNVGATSLFTTAEDMLKWAGNFGHPVVGDSAFIKQICAPGKLSDGTPINYGFALKKGIYGGREAIEHGGADAGFRAMFAYFSAEDFGMAMLANYPPENFAKFLDGVVDFYLNNAERPRNYHPTVTTANTKDLDELAGSYIADFTPMITLERDGNQLSLRMGSGAATPLVFREDGSFDFGDGSRSGGHYRAQRDQNGHVVAIEAIIGQANYGQRIGENPEYARSNLFRRFTPEEPTTAMLEEIAGDYRSPELDITYTFATQDGKLMARSIWSWEPLVFVPSSRDRFDSDDHTMGVAEITRNAQGKPIALRVHGGRTRHVLLERVPGSTA